MTVKEIKEMSTDELKEKMTDAEWDRMIALNMNIYDFADYLKDSAELSGQKDNEEHITISAYLEYLEDIEENK